MNAMEAPTADPLVYRPLTPTAIQQLPASRNPVLLARELGERPVIIASPWKPSLRDGFYGLDFHTPIVPGQSARVARTVCQFGPLGVPEA